MATFLRSNRSIVLTGVFVTFLFLLQLCNAKVENTSEYEYDPEKTIEENFFSYSQFGLYYFRRIHFFDKYFTIVLFAIGFPGNFISFLVWSSKRMYHGNSAAVYLAALSLNDTVVLAIALFRDLTKIWDVPFYPTPGSCEVLETITLTVQYASPLFVLAFTIERWLAICQPFMVSRICSVQRAVRICIGIIVLTLLVCSPMAYLIGTDPLGCQPRSWAVFHFTTTLEILYSLVTPLLVLTFNCLVINEMSKIRRSQMMKMLPGTKRNSRSGSDMDEVGFFRRLFRKSRERRLESGVPMTVALTKDAYRRKTEIDSGGGDASSPKFKSTTIMLLVVSFYVIIATLLGGLWYVLDIKFTIEAYAKWKKRQFDESEVVAQALRLRMIKTVCDELALSHFAMGFVLYFSTGKNFREEVRRLFSRCGVFSGRKHTGAFQSSLTNDAIKGHVSRLQSREKTKTADSTIPMTSVTGPTREKGTSAKHSGFFHFKTSKRRSDFPGLDQCGHRGERQPSKLSNMQKLKTNSDPFVPI